MSDCCGSVGFSSKPVSQKNKLTMWNLFKNERSESYITVIA